MKKRNPEATCETCPYFDNSKINYRTSGICRKPAPVFFATESQEGANQAPMEPHEWCGEHPDFFLSETNDD